MAKKYKDKKRQTRISLAPLDRLPPLPNIALGENSLAASVRYDKDFRQPLPRITKPTLRRSTATALPQGTLDVGFARALSKHSSRPEPLLVPDPSLQSVQANPIHMSDSSDDDILANKTKRKRRAADQPNATAFFKPPLSSPSGPILSSPTSRVKKNPSQNSIFKSSPAKEISKRRSDSEESEGIRSSAKRRPRNADLDSHESRATRDLIYVGSRGTIEEREEESESDDVHSPLSRRTSKRLRVPTRSTAKKIVSPLNETRSETNEQLSTLRQFALESDLLEDSDSDEVISSTRRRRLDSTRRPAESPKRNRFSDSPPQRRKRIAHEKEDLAEDLDFLRKSPTPQDTPARTKISAKEERRRHLDQIRQQREQRASGVKSSPVQHPSSSENLNDAERLHSGEEDESDGSLEGYADRGDQDLDDDLDDFIAEEEDGGGEGGLEGNSEIPIEFTHHVRKPIKDHFRVVVEWMVQKKLNPGFPRNDDIYKLAFNKVADEVTGYAGSKFISSVWKPDFHRALKARPTFNVSSTGAALFDKHCEACNRTNHPSTFAVTLSGKAYDPSTLEPLKDESASDDSSDDEDNDTRSVDMNGNELSSEDHEFYLGRTCKQNAETAHSLLHWKWHLNDWVLDWLEHEGYDSNEQVIERNKWSSKKKTKYANKVFDDLNDREMKSLWRDFKINLQTAKHAKGSGLQLLR